MSHTFSFLFVVDSIYPNWKYKDEHTNHTQDEQSYITRKQLTRSETTSIIKKLKLRISPRTIYHDLNKNIKKNTI